MTLWFLVPAHGRFDLTAICLRQLRRTCDALTADGIEASAIVMAEDENLDTARELGFGTVERENAPLGRKWNDGYQAACDPEYNPRPLDYVVPMGSDDWLDPELLLSTELPDDDEILCFRKVAFVREDGRKLARLNIVYDGGIGIRVIPRALIATARYRPASEDRNRAIDTSTLNGITRENRGCPRLRYHDLHSLQLIDFKSEIQLNSYSACLKFEGGGESDDPFGQLAAVYPREALKEMRALYAVREEVAA